jgi:predicted HicB family RNase H-like nuclease
MAKTGRPTRDPSGKASKLFPVRLTDAERAEYERAATRAEISVSEWIRDRLAKAARREAKQG